MAARQAPEPDLACPLCGYNLRGLADPRCPECGFRFTWDELRDEQRNGHRYLLEHATRRRFRAFWSTYWRTGHPQRFWREVSPANPVNVGRLVTYWTATSLLVATALALVFGSAAVQVGYIDSAARDNWLPVPGSPGHFAPAMSPGYVLTTSEIDALYPLPLSPGFARKVLERTTSGGDLHPVLAVVVVVAWPWLSAVALLLFAASMRRAQVRWTHVLRVALYGCDFGLLIAAFCVVTGCLMTQSTDLRIWARHAPSHAAAPAVALVLACAAVATYRLRLAYARYLRFDHPTLTVVAAQVIVALTVAVALVAIA